MSFTEQGMKSDARGHPGGLSPPEAGPYRITYADPRVLQGLVGRDALGRIDSQHLVDEVFGFRSNGVPLRGWELQKEALHRPKLKLFPRQGLWMEAWQQEAPPPPGTHSRHRPQP